MPVAPAAYVLSLVMAVASTGTDEIRYRSLTRDDFLGESPPATMGNYEDELGAVTCVELTMKSGLQIAEVNTEAGAQTFQATISDLSYFAVMNRSCSWWNPKSKGEMPDEYVLQHEQIHFAIFEAEARRLNRTTDEIVAEVGSGSGLTGDEAKWQLGPRLCPFLDRATSAAMQRSREFDAVTSRVYRPRDQEEWLAMIEAELAESGS